MTSPDLVEIVSTFAGEAEALEVARRLVEERLAACGNVAAVRSVYRWEGQVHGELEFVLALKTTAARADRTEERLRDLHPYRTPAILRFAVLSASPEYAAWVATSVDPAGGGEDPVA